MIVTPIQEIYRRYRLNEQRLDWYYPLEYQRDAFLDTCSNQLFEGSNQSGKTDTGAMKVIQILLGVHPTIYREPPQFGRLVATSLTEGALDVTMAKLKNYIPKNALKGRSWDKGFNLAKRKILFRNGSTLQLMAATQDIDVFKGAVLDIFWMDEECPEAIFDENLTRLGSRNGLFIGTMTPHRGMTWSYRRLVKPARAGSPEYSFYRFSVLNNYMVDRMAHIKKASLKSDREIDISIKGKRIALEGMVYSYFDETIHCIKPFKLPDKSQIRLGVDLGFTNPTAALIAGFTPENKKYIINEYYETLKTVDQNGFDLGVKMKEEYPGVQIKRITIDPNSGAQRSGQTGERNFDVFRKAFARGYGKRAPCTMGERGAGAVEHRINIINQLLLPEQGKDPQLQVFKTCIHTIDEFEGYVFKNKKTENVNKFEKPKDYKDHLMNGMEYLFESNPKFVVSTAVPKQNYYQSGCISR